MKNIVLHRGDNVFIVNWDNVVEASNQRYNPHSGLREEGSTLIYVDDIDPNIFNETLEEIAKKLDVVVGSEWSLARRLRDA